MVGLLMMAFVFVAIGGFFIRRNRKQGHRYGSLRRKGIVVEGYITERRTGIAGKGARWYSLRYSYQYKGKSYQHEQPVWQHYYTPHDIGAAVPVSCLPEHPEVAALLEDQCAETSANLRVMVGWVLSGLGVFAAAITVASAFLPHR